MKAIRYSYSVIRYVHDAGTGESLNVGVVVHAPDVPFFDVQVELRYKRLSEAFSGFDGEQYKAVLRQLETAIRQESDRMTNSIDGLMHWPRDVDEAMRRYWPDRGLCFQFGPARAGVAADPAQALAALFSRMVASQWPEESDTERRTDEVIWNGFRRPLDDCGVAPLLRPKTLTTSTVEIKFQHAVKNGRWHVLQPMSLDMVKPDSIQRKAAQWAGYGTGLDRVPDLDCLYFLLGRPRIESNLKAYERARNLLHQMPVKHELVEEHEAEKFAADFAADLRRHGVELSG